jgi:CheY-like chemotaxis protein
MSKILVIEDDTNHLELVLDILKFGGHTLFAAHNAHMAESILKKEQVDFIVTDISLPGISGLEFIKSLHERNIYIPFVVVTGSIEKIDRETAEFLNAHAYFLKPLNNPAQFLFAFK